MEEVFRYGTEYDEVFVRLSLNPPTNIITLFSCLAVESGSESQITVPRDAVHQQLGTVVKSN
jgi:hypothetical protein